MSTLHSERRIQRSHCSYSFFLYQYKINEFSDCCNPNMAHFQQTRTIHFLITCDNESQAQAYFGTILYYN
jgi:hypothetical protein